MSRRPCTFRQSDVTRALKAAKAAGVEVDRIEIDHDGKLIVVLTKKAIEQKSEDLTKLL
jgi:nitrate reductase NapAB chaperone NapD